jgi:excinuclease ABC subunit C
LLNKLQFVSIAKREEELFLPWEKESIVLEKDSLELRLVQKIRDEAHRFAITFNRDTRITEMKKNILESLPWFWPRTRKKLLTKYHSVENLANIDKKELWKILNKTQIETLENHGII